MRLDEADIIEKETFLFSFCLLDIKDVFFLNSIFFIYKEIRKLFLSIRKHNLNRLLLNLILLY